MQLPTCQARRRLRKGCTHGRRVSSVYPRAILPEGLFLTSTLMMSEAVVGRHRVAVPFKIWFTKAEFIVMCIQGENRL